MSDQREIAVADIDPDPEQPRKRFDEAALLALAQNMKDIGQQVPVIVYEVQVPDAERSK
jgi:ParB-like chromosome segregation protein Spo0J